MPFKSKSQMKRFGAMVKEGKMSTEEFKKWEKDTPHISKLPDKVGPQKVGSVGKVKVK